jgi:hypothetical protein
MLKSAAKAIRQISQVTLQQWLNIDVRNTTPSANTISSPTIDGVPISEHQRLQLLRYETLPTEARREGWQPLNISARLALLAEAGFELSSCGYLGMPKRGINARIYGLQDESNALWSVALVLGAPGSRAPDGRGYRTPDWMRSAQDWIDIPPTGDILASQLSAALQQGYPNTAIYVVVCGKQSLLTALVDPQGNNSLESVQRLGRWIDQLLPERLTIAA